jgi:hypothetical protein
MTWLTSDYGSMVRVSTATLLATSDITPRGLGSEIHNLARRGGP